MGKPAIDLTGESFGKYRVIERAGVAASNGAATWLCRCDCGEVRVVSGGELRRGKTRSCGCAQRELAAEQMRRHGAAGNRFDSTTRTPEYRSWLAMKDRCQRQDHPAWHRYGGRGISVCDRWSVDFSTFLEDMGPRPRGASIDRVDNDGNYEPDNCRWATRKEQAANKTYLRGAAWRLARGMAA